MWLSHLTRHAVWAGCLAAAPWAVHADWVVDPAGTQTPGSGSLHISCTNAVAGGVMLTESGQWLRVKDMTVLPGGVLDGGSGLIDVNGNWTNNGTFNAGTGTVRLSTQCGTSTVQLTGASTFSTLQIASAPGDAAITVQLPADGKQITVNQLLNLGNGSVPVKVTGPACAGILLGSGAAMPAMTNVTLGPDIWIAKQAPSPCPSNPVDPNNPGNPGNPGGTAAPVPSLSTGASLLLTGLVAGAAAWLRRRKPMR